VTIRDTFRHSSIAWPRCTCVLKIQKPCSRVHAGASSLPRGKNSALTPVWRKERVRSYSSTEVPLSIGFAIDSHLLDFLLHSFRILQWRNEHKSSSLLLYLPFSQFVKIIEGAINSNFNTKPKFSSKTIHKIFRYLLENQNQLAVFLITVNVRIENIFKKARINLLSKLNHLPPNLWRSNCLVCHVR